ncbi:MAG: carboxypeptidase-like regulatory domain-containing protein [Thermaurantimonas sp.]|uniref:carboxypeptidase-like regulatory domain-containing protein n=1 Tax=Thermaurantimonas sp. TaxID=2681568 RepID=UPI00391CB127
MRIKIFLKKTGIFSLIFYIHTAIAQEKISGTVRDSKDRDAIPGANVVIKETGKGTSTDMSGRFVLEHKGSLPVTLEVSFVGYKTKRIEIKKSGNYTIDLDEDKVMLSEVSVVEQRLSEKQKESALTVEAMDALAIKETPAASFYDGLGSLKGVDLTAASLGFKIINTRGFNSTSPVRSLQIIDGVDNQAPGLNFSLGNFLGASDLDVMNVDIIAGASSAFYGPNAFNGVISMTTKDPFLFPGTSVSFKTGERMLNEIALRHARVFKDKKGIDRVAIKFNAFYLQANDWVADNYNPTEQSERGKDNPGWYDAVNRYGDEQMFDDGQQPRTYPGLDRFYRTGIEEVHLVDYNTRNLKLALSLHHKFSNDRELILASNFGYGTTVYQGDNRYSLKDIKFYQNRIEFRKKNKFFIRAYATNEDAGNSYDAYFTALRMQNALVADNAWGERYRSFWNSFEASTAQSLPKYPTASWFNERELWLQQYQEYLAYNRDTLRQLHNRNRQRVDQFFGGPLVPGTRQFDSLFTYFTTRTFTEGGTKFFDRSALYHFHGQYEWDIKGYHLVAGGNTRLYVPNSRGNIFSDSMRYNRFVVDTMPNGQLVYDSVALGYNRITNFEFGVYAGVERKFFDNKHKFNFTVRLDKNQNFPFLVSPALSWIYQINNLNTLRVSLSSAIRNPTLQDQYLYYNVGRAILLGNLNGVDSLVSPENLQEYLRKNQQGRLEHEFDYYNVAPIRPERVQTAEVGYRTTLFDKLYLDMNYYYSWYQDFIGFNIGLLIRADGQTAIDRVSSVQAYRVAANARDRVTTQGFSIGANYYFWDNYTFTGNYTWNVLNTATDDPIIPAFNTPEHKYNIGLNARDLKFKSTNQNLFGFSVNYRWIQGFLFEGSPQFTGSIDSYDMLDAQVNYLVKKWKTTFKLGGTNLLNNKVFMVFGGPRVGRLAYFSAVVDF